MVSLKYLNSHHQCKVFPFPQYRKSVGIFGKVVKILTRHVRSVCVSYHDCNYTSLPSTAYADADTNIIANVALHELLHGLTCFQNTTRFKGVHINVILYTPIRNVRLPMFCLSRNWEHHNLISYTEFYSNRKMSTENRNGFTLSSTLRLLLCWLSQNLKNLINFSENLPCEILYKEFKSTESADKIWLTPLSETWSSQDLLWGNKLLLSGIMWSLSVPGIIRVQFVDKHE